MTSSPTTRNTQATRLFDLRRQSGYSQREAAEKIGISSPSIFRYESNDKITIKMPVLRKLATLYKTTPEFIETGKHPSASDAFPASAGGMMTGYSYQSNARVVSIDSMREIPYLPIRARATFAESFADDSYKYEPETTIQVPNVPVTKDYENPLLVEVDGDSMDSGENSALRSGAHVLVTPVQPADWQYMPSGVYCFVYGTNFVIKRVKDNELLKTGLLQLHSDNPVGGTTTVRGEDLRAVWKVRRGVMTPIS